ncbi:MAG: polysaccharide deacetylase family protein [Clostridia bacterium]|nr:polysaccharide deacetylase family protein [Clostridia bacterium]MBQ3869924.1 polysaccharide deacetylase family protein [Clostridia bacterium]
MKRRTKIVSAFLILLSLYVNVRAEACGYYIMRKKDHERPVTDACFSFMKDHNAFYIGKDDKVIYLTFDAGYENGNIERIADTLKKHNAKAAFFVLDNIVRRNTDLIVRLSEDGHLICNHTSKHKDCTKLSKEEFENEINSLESAYKELTGKTLEKYFRPPEGRFDEKTLSYADELGYKTVFWSFAYADWDNNKQPDRGYAKKLILDNTHNGEVILLHPTSKTNADILDELLNEWERAGYRFGSLEELG